MTKLTINIAFEIGQIVYRVTDTDSEPCMVTAIRVDNQGTMYYLEDGNTYYAMQLSSKPSLIFSN
jgi:hypothetical protein